MFTRRLILGTVLLMLLTALVLLGNSTPRVLAQEIPQTNAPEIPFAPDAPLPLDHFWCYRVTSTAVNEVVQTLDQFDSTAQQTNIGVAYRFCNPVKKRHGDKTSKIIDPNAHLTMYVIGDGGSLLLRADVTNQFGKQRLKVYGPPTRFAVPTKKEGHEYPTDLDHFKCYKVKGPNVNTIVALKDQFQQANQVTVSSPYLLCNPSYKLHNGNAFPVKHPNAHLVCYWVTVVQFSTRRDIQNQFRSEELRMRDPDMLCVPSKKTIVQN